MAGETVLSIFAEAFAANPGRPGVQRTPELGRILGLPRRMLDLDAGTVDGTPIADLASLYLKEPGRCAEPRCPICAGGGAKLWPTQSAALLEAERAWGLLAPMGVGSGKTLVTLLLPDALQSERAVLLVPASLRDQLLGRDIADYGRHFHLPIDKITVVAYSELSTVKGAEALEKAKPDLVIADECHNLARYQSARTKRFVRYMREHPGTRFCGLSGTITRKSLRDFAALSELALRAGSPVPQRWSDLQEWADALDPIRDPIPVGALRVFATSQHHPDSDDERAAVRDGFRRRLVETPGVVATSESWEGASLVVAALRPAVPGVVADTLAVLRKTWQIEDEEIEDPMRLVMVARQIASGFYYRWCWPGGVRDLTWLGARAAWHKAVRDILRRSTPGMDSPLLVARAAKRGELNSALTDVWFAWEQVKDRHVPHPPVEAVWLDDFVIQAALNWATGGGIVWYSHDAVGEALGRHLPLYGSGEDAGAAREPVIACSIRAQGTGKNLQHYSRNLVVDTPASGATWEQLIGRTHRPGQQADEVLVDVMLHTGELAGALFGSVEDARYVQQTQGQWQKLLVARRIGW